MFSVSSYKAACQERCNTPLTRSLHIHCRCHLSTCTVYQRDGLLLRHPKGPSQERSTVLAHRLMVFLGPWGTSPVHIKPLWASYLAQLVRLCLSTPIFFFPAKSTPEKQIYLLKKTKVLKYSLKETFRYYQLQTLSVTDTGSVRDVLLVVFAFHADSWSSSLHPFQ